MPYQNPNAPLFEGFGNLAAALMLAPRMAAKNRQSELDRDDRAEREDDALARSLRGELAATERRKADMENANEQKGLDRDLQRELYGKKQDAAATARAQAFAPQYVLKSLENQYPDTKERFAKTFEAGINPNNLRMTGPGNDILPEADPMSPNAWQHADPGMPDGITPDDPHGSVPAPAAPPAMPDLPLREALHIGGKGARGQAPVITPDDPHGDPSTMGVPSLSPPDEPPQEPDLLGNAIYGNEAPVPEEMPVPVAPRKAAYPQPAAGAPRLEPVSKKGRDAARTEAANPNTPAPDPAYVKTLVGLSSTNPVKLKSLLVELKNRNLSEYQAVAKALRENANAE